MKKAGFKGFQKQERNILYAALRLQHGSLKGALKFANRHDAEGDFSLLRKDIEICEDLMERLEYE